MMDPVLPSANGLASPPRGASSLSPPPAPAEAVATAGAAAAPPTAAPGQAIVDVAKVHQLLQTKRRREEEQMAKLKGNRMELRRLVKQRSEANKALRAEYQALLHGASSGGSNSTSPQRGRSSGSSSPLGAASAGVKRRAGAGAGAGGISAPFSSSSPRRKTGGGVGHKPMRGNGAAAGGAGNWRQSLKDLRRLVLVKGLPTATEAEGAGGRGEGEECSLRGLVWKRLLGVMHIDAMLYVRLVEQGASILDPKIRNDTFRTFQGAVAFRKKVPEEEMIRLNNAFVRLNFPVPDAGLKGGGGGRGGGGGGGGGDVAGDSVQQSRLEGGSREEGRPGEGQEEGGGARRRVGGGHTRRKATDASSEKAVSGATRYASPPAALRLPDHAAVAETGAPAAGDGEVLSRSDRTKASSQSPIKAGRREERKREKEGNFKLGVSGIGGEGGGGGGGGREEGHETIEGRGKDKEGDWEGYVQAMSILCGPILFVMPEVDAFFCFNAFLTRHIPRYVNASIYGVHAGCDLVDRLLQVLDPQLYRQLFSQRPICSKMYAMPLIISLHACCPPLGEVLKLWDALFAFGVHLELLIVVAQLILLRDKLLSDSRPHRFLNVRNLPEVDAELLVSAAFSLLPHIPPALMRDVVQHPFAAAAGEDSDADGSGGSSGGSADVVSGGGAAAAAAVAATATATATAGGVGTVRSETPPPGPDRASPPPPPPPPTARTTTPPPHQ